MDEHKRRVVFSQGAANKKDYGTPQVLFDNLNKRYGFTLDAAASDENAKLPKYFTSEDNGLEKSWEGERVFCNPPYGIKENRQWIAKGYSESQKDALPKVFLIAARTDSQFFADYCSMASNIYFIKGRLTFEGANDAAGFPSAIIVFHSIREGTRNVQWCNREFTEFW